MFLFSGCAATPPARPVREDPAAIEAVVAAYERAREAQDAATLAGLLIEDTDQLTSRGVWRRGRDTALAGMQQSTRQNPGDRALAVDQVRFLGPDAALADARYTITSPDGTTRNLWSTFVLVRDQAAWRIAAIRNMEPAAPSP